MSIQDSIFRSQLEVLTGGAGTLSEEGFPTSSDVPPPLSAIWNAGVLL